MAFRFIHTSDWQIGKPFRNFEERVAGRLEGARLTAIDRIAELADEHGARHILVAGDIYDAQSVPLKTLMQPVRRMERAGHLTWWLLPGNHDPARVQGVWQRLRAEGLPVNLRVVDEPAVVEMEPGVFLLPAPLTAQSLTQDPTGWMDAAATPPGALRIGLAHGSIKGFGSAGDSAVSIDPERAVKANLDYLALGDWHGSARINGRTWYSGTPEPDRFPDNAPGSVLAVGLAAQGTAPQVAVMASAQFVWAKRVYEISGVGDLAGVERELEGLAGDMGALVLRLRLQGHVGLEEISAVERWSREFEAKVQFLDADTTGLLPFADDDDLSVFAVSQELGEAARFLRKVANDSGDDRQMAAAAALARLAVLTRQETAEGV